MHSTNVFAYIDVRAPAYTCIPYDKRVSPFSIRLLRTAGPDVKGTYKYKLYRTASHLNSISNSLKPEAARRLSCGYISTNQETSREKPNTPHVFQE